MKVQVYIAPDSGIKTHSRIQYLIEVLNEHPISKQAQVSFIPTTEKSNSNYNVPPSRILSDQLSAAETEKYNLGERLVHCVTEGEVQTKEADLFGTLFFHLARYEERSLKQVDYLKNKKQFEDQLLLVRKGLVKVPVVDELIQAFIESLTLRKIMIPKYRALTHDIDFIQKFKSPFSILRKIAGHFRHRKPIKGLPFLWQSYTNYLLHDIDSFDTFDWMLSTREFEKTIFFLMGGKHKEDNQYSTENPIFRKAIELAQDRGYKVGIHPSYESWEDAEMMIEEKERLENVVGSEIVHSRQHFLNFDIEKTPKLLESIGIKEDSSLGYTRYNGYRCGTAFPYKLYDFENEKAFDVIEKPLVFMDSAWIYESNRRGAYDVGFLESCNGTLNFHNSTFDELGQRNIDLVGPYKSLFTI